MHVLLVEDDELIARGIRAGLQLHGLTVDRFASAASAQAAQQAAAYDVCILDLGLPDPHRPVLVLPARDAVEHRVAGLQAGADDYLLKPFDLDELVARLHALLRRASGRSTDRIAHGPLCVDAASGEVLLHGAPVELSRRELALLRTLLQHPRQLLSAEQLRDSLYGFEQDVESNAVNVHIHHLRRKLGAGIVETVRGQGYRLGEIVP